MHGLMFIATFCWAGNIVAVKEGLTGFTPSALTQLRVAGAALVFAVIYFFRHGRPRLRLSRREWGFMVLVALSGVTFNQLFFISGVARSSVAHAGLIVALGPVMVLVLSCLLRLEALTVPKFVGMLISFAGVAVPCTTVSSCAASPPKRRPRAASSFPTPPRRNPRRARLSPSAPADATSPAS